MTTAEPVFGTEWSASLRLGAEAELRSWLEVAQEACDACRVTEDAAS